MEAKRRSNDETAGDGGSQRRTAQEGEWKTRWSMAYDQETQSISYWFDGDFGNEYQISLEHALCHILKRQNFFSSGFSKRRLTRMFYPIMILSICFDYYRPFI